MTEMEGEGTESPLALLSPHATALVSAVSEDTLGYDGDGWM